MPPFRLYVNGTEHEISAAALLKSNAVPNEAEMRVALDQNLCRCGSHNRIVRAVLRAVQEASAG